MRQRHSRARRYILFGGVPSPFLTSWVSQFIMTVSCSHRLAHSPACCLLYSRATIGPSLSPVSFPALRWVSLSFCIVATLLTVHQIRQHLHWNTAPRLRRYIIRIISMVPIYAWSSWLGLTYPEAALYFDFLRECYEAFVIYCFFQLLVQALGGEERLAYRLAGKEKVQQHQVPFCCLPTWEYADWDCMTAEERDGVKQLIKDSESHRAGMESNKKQQQVDEEQKVAETGIHDEPPVSLERVKTAENEVILQHPPNATRAANASSPISHLPISSSSRALVDSKASSRAASRGHSRHSTSTFFGTTFGGNTSQPSTPKQPSVYMAHSLAHSTVSNPFTPSMSNSSHNFSSVSSSPTSSGSGTSSPIKLPYLYSPFLYYTQVGTIQSVTYTHQNKYIALSDCLAPRRRWQRPTGLALDREVVLG